MAPVGQDPGPGLGGLPEEGLPPRGAGPKGSGAEAEAGLQGLAFLQGEAGEEVALGLVDLEGLVGEEDLPHLLPREGLGQGEEVLPAGEGAEAEGVAHTPRLPRPGPLSATLLPWTGSSPQDPCEIGRAHV